MENAKNAWSHHYVHASMLTESKENKNRTSMVQGPRVPGSTASFNTQGSTPCRRVKGPANSTHGCHSPDMWHRKVWGSVPIKENTLYLSPLRIPKKDEESYEVRSKQTTPSVKPVLGGPGNLIVPQVIMY